MADLRKDDKISTSKPAVAIPTKAPGQKGKTPTRLKLDKNKNRARHLRVDEFVDEYFEKQHQVLSYRQGSKGKLCSRVLVKTV